MNRLIVWSLAMFAAGGLLFGGLVYMGKENADEVVLCPDPAEVIHIYSDAYSTLSAQTKRYLDICAPGLPVPVARPSVVE